jgi:hypothetical protein
MIVDSLSRAASRNGCANALGVTRGLDKKRHIACHRLRMGERPHPSGQCFRPRRQSVCAVAMVHHSLSIAVIQPLVRKSCRIPPGFYRISLCVDTYAGFTQGWRDRRSQGNSCSRLPLARVFTLPERGDKFSIPNGEKPISPSRMVAVSAFHAPFWSLARMRTRS